MTEEGFALWDIRCNRQRNADMIMRIILCRTSSEDKRQILLKVFIGVITQSGRVSALQAESSEFDSLWLHTSGKILGAQGQEVGSIPVTLGL